MILVFFNNIYEILFTFDMFLKNICGLGCRLTEVCASTEFF